MELVGLTVERLASSVENNDTGRYPKNPNPRTQNPRTQTSRNASPKCKPNSSTPRAEDFSCPEGSQFHDSQALHPKPRSPEAESLSPSSNLEAKVRGLRARRPASFYSESYTRNPQPAIYPEARSRNYLTTAAS